MKRNSRRYFRLPDKANDPIYVNAVDSINYNWLLYEESKNK